MQQRFTFLPHFREDLQQRLEVTGFERLVIGAHIVVPQIRQQHAERGEVPGNPGNHQSGNMQLACNFGGMQRACASERHHGEVARVMAAADGDGLHGERHFGDRDADDSMGGRLHAHAEGFRDFLLNRRSRRLHVERHFATQETVGRKPAQHEIGVSDGRLGSALSVADRTGMAARAAWADLQATHFVDPGDGAATGANLDNIDNGIHDRVAAGLAAHIIALCDGRFAPLDKTDLGGRSAHIEGYDIAHPQIAHDLRAGDDAADGA